MRTPADGVISEITQRILVANRTNLWRETSSSSTRWDTKSVARPTSSVSRKIASSFSFADYFRFHHLVSLCLCVLYLDTVVWTIYILHYIYGSFSAIANVFFTKWHAKMTTCHDPIYLSKLQLKRYIINIYAQATKPRQVSLFQLPLLTSLSKPIDASTSYYFHPKSTTIEP